MATNPYISQRVRSEQNLYEDLIIESIKFYGEDVYYLPREIVNLDEVFLDDVPSHFTDAYKIEMYIENTEGFDGEGDLFTKFGIELRDQATFVVARKRWRQMIGDFLEENQFRPREGDVIYLPMSQSIFQIMKVDTETPFYQLGKLPLFRMQCELFEYSGEDFDTGIDDIDVIEQEAAYQYELQMNDPEVIDAELTADINAQGQVTSVNIIDGGSGYTSIPTVTVSSPDSGFGYFGNSSLNVAVGRGHADNYNIVSPNGSIEFFVYPEFLPAVGDRHIMFITGGSETAVSQRMAVGYNDSGTLLLQLFESSDVLELDGFLQVGKWSHLGFFVENATLKIYIDGVLTDELEFSEDNDFLSAEGFLAGYSAAGTIATVEWKPMLGWMDEFRAIAGDYIKTLNWRLVDSVLTVPTEEFIEDGNTAYLAHWDGRDAVIELEITEGVVTNAIIVDTGNLYDYSPQLEVSNPGTEGAYITGETVTQAGEGFEMRGEVTYWNSETLVLRVAHSGASDGKFHNWVDGRPVVGEYAAYYPKAVIENDSIDSLPSLDQKTVFDNFAEDFLDFSESNPFGDVL